MCGIAGIYHWSDAPIDRQRLEQMTQALAHRGPDGSGQFYDGPVGLGHRRLSIIDPTQGHQPMLNEQASLAVAFNGEIYNYQELRAELKTLGYRFKTDSDTEVILHAYDAWGEACQSRFNGMWAFALWDGNHKKLLLSRDRIGEKPLFYAQASNRLLFASEPKALFAYGYPRQWDVEQLEIYLVLGYVPAPYSFFKGIHKLEAGHYLVITEQGITERRHWEFPQVPEAEMRNDAPRVLEEFEYLLKDSVRLRMRSDVPFGAFLSGGLDSASIVALMGEHSQHVNTFTIGFEEKAFDERDLARAVANQFATTHHEKVVGMPVFEEALRQTLQIYDEPFGDASAIPSAQVCEFAAQHVKMVLTGDGGDEVLSGYPSYQSEKFGHYYHQIPGVLRRGIEGGVFGLAGITRGAPMYQLQRIGGVLQAAGMTFRERLISKSAWVDIDTLNAVFQERASARPIEDYLDEVFAGCRFSDPFYLLMYFQYKVSLPERMLTKVDRVSMANSLECRAPFLDHRLVELLAGVSKDVKMPGANRKHLLKESVGKILPKELLQAPKRGFTPPLRNWITEARFAQLTSAIDFTRFNLNPEKLTALAKANGEGRRDAGNFLWMILLLLSLKESTENI